MLSVVSINGKSTRVTENKDRVCSTAVECTSCKQEVMGLNPIRRRAFFLILSLYLCFIIVSQDAFVVFPLKMLT